MSPGRGTLACFQPCLCLESSLRPGRWPVLSWEHRQPRRPSVPGTVRPPLSPRRGRCSPSPAGRCPPGPRVADGPSVEGRPGTEPSRRTRLEDAALCLPPSRPGAAEALNVTSENVRTPGQVGGRQTARGPRDPVSDAALGPPRFSSASYLELEAREPENPEANGHFREASRSLFFLPEDPERGCHRAPRF